MKASEIKAGTCVEVLETGRHLSIEKFLGIRDGLVELEIEVSPYQSDYYEDDTYILYLTEDTEVELLPESKCY